MSHHRSFNTEKKPSKTLLQGIIRLSTKWQMEKKWLMVDDITSLTLKEEKMKQMAAKLTKQKKEYHRSRCLIPMKRDDSGHRGSELAGLLSSK